MARDGSVVIEIDGDSSKFESVLSKVGSIATGALTAATGAIVAVGTAAVSAYADYEQLVGGIETLFGAGGKSIEEYAASVGKSTAEVKDEYDTLMLAQETMMAQAQGAYLSAGMSANEYMATATSFAAALTSSCESTLEAAEIADVAIGDMSDNANKMGTDIGLIQNAYQGFAKQNYTMLDNLKLGYGGTKSEMERLIADANELRAAQGLNADLTIDSYADVVMAIHEVQVSMGIYGTTAAEAGETIQGSLAMTKASWQNLLVGLADGTQDFDALLTAFIDSVTIFGGNLIPRIEIVLEGIVKLVSALGPKIAEMLPGVVESVLPGLLSGATSLAMALVDVIPSLIDTLVQVILDQGPSLIQAGLDLILSLCSGFTSALPSLITAATEILATLVTMLTDPAFLVGLVSAAADMLLALTQGITEALPILIAAAPVILQNLVTAITESLPLIIDCALTLIQTLAQSLVENLPLLAESAISMVDSLATGIQENLPVIVESAVTLLQTLIQTLIDNLPLVVETAITLALALIEGLLSCLPDLVSAAFDLARSLLDTIMETDWMALGSDILDLIVNGLSSMIGALISSAVEIGTTLWNEITNVDWWSLGSNIISGIASGVSGAVGLLADAAWNVAQSALNAIKSALGINSPSKVFAKEVGRWIPPGIGQGAEDAMPELNEDMRKQLMHTIDDASAAVASEVGHANRRLAGTGGTGSVGGDSSVITNDNGITVVVYYTGNGDPEDVRTLGRQIGSEASRELRRKGLPAV